MAMTFTRKLMILQIALLVALTAWGGLAPAQEGGSDTSGKKKDETRYGLDINVGYADYQMNLKPDCWYPVWVTLQARKGDLEGVVSIRQPRNPMVSHVPFVVAEGSRKRYLTYYKFDGIKAATLDVTIEGRGLRRETMEYTQRYAAEEEQYILALDEEAGRFRFLVRQGVEMTVQGLRQNPGQIQTIGMGDICGGVKVVYGDMSHLPTDPVALEGLDAIIINTPQVREMSEAQWKALQGWMAQGGRVMLAGGGYQPFIEQSVLKGACGFNPRAPEAVDVADIFGETRLTESGDAESWIVAWPGDLDAIEGARVDLGSKAHPLIVSRGVGRGRFYYAASAFDAGFITGVTARVATESFWPRLLERHFSQSPLDGLVAQTEAITGMMLQRPFSFNLVGVGWVFRFLALYIFLALPLNWLICIKMKRREWAWLVAVVLALGFAGYGYSSGLRSQEKEFIANEVTMLRRSGGQSAARATTFSAIFSPRRYRVDLEMPGSVFPAKMTTNLNVRGYGGEDQDLYSSRELGVFYGAEDVVMQGLFFYPWSARNLRADYTVEELGSVEIAAPVEVDDQGQMQGTLVNSTGMNFKALWILDANRMWVINEGLADGASLDLAQVSRSELDSRQLVTSYKEVLERDFGGQNRPYNSWQIDQVFEQMGNGPMPVNGVYLIGLADRTLSPLVDGMELDRRKGLLLYEQEVINPSGKKWPLDQVTWKGVTSGVSPDQQFTHHPNLTESKMKNGTLLSLTEEPVTLTPDRPIDVADDAALSLAVTIKCYPNDDYKFVGLEMKTMYALAGFKARIYNRASEKWVDLRLVNGEPLAIAPASDYLHPASGEIAMVADCRAESLLYRLCEQDGEAVEDGEPQLQKEIWGKDVTQNTNMQGMPGRHGIPGLPGMIDTMCINFKVESMTINEQ